VERVYTEEELEEFIVLKSLKNFNSSKLGSEENQILDGIIKDIFIEASRVKDADILKEGDYGPLKQMIQQSFSYLHLDYSYPVQ